MEKFLRTHAVAIVMLALVVVTSAAYWRVPGNGYIVYYDDGAYVTQNPHIKAGLTAGSIRWAFTGIRCGNWHPLTWISHMVDYRLFGLKPMGHHLVNLILHLANTLLLFAILRRMTGSLWRSAFVAALFAVHPLHVESVAWVAERKDVLSTFFWMLAMGAYVLYSEKPGIKRYLPVILLYALGLMAKPMLVTLPLVLLMLDYWPLRRMKQGWKLILEKLPLLVMAAGSSIVTVIAQNKGEAMTALNVISIGVRISNALVSYVAYVEKMLWPVRLAMFYPHPKDSLASWKVAGSAIVLIGFSALVLRTTRKRPYMGFGWLWYLVTLVPVIGVVQVGLQAMADRYTYIPLMGLFIIVAWLVPDLVVETKRWGEKAPVVLAVFACLVIAVLAVGTWVQVGYWRDSITVFQRAIDVTEGNFLAHMDLGLALSKQGKLDEAREHYEQAAAIRPDWDEAHYNLGTIYGKLGDADSAIEAYREALRLNPKFTAARTNLAGELAKLGRTQEALQMGQDSTGTSPQSADLHYNMGCVLEKQGRYDEAMKEYREAVRLRPGFGQAHNNLAVGYFFQENYAEAWKAVHSAQKSGFRPDPTFLKALSERMPDPGS